MDEIALFPHSAAKLSLLYVLSGYTKGTITWMKIAASTPSPPSYGIPCHGHFSFAPPLFLDSSNLLFFPPFPGLAMVWVILSPPGAAGRFLNVGFTGSPPSASLVAFMTGWICAQAYVIPVCSPELSGIFFSHGFLCMAMSAPHALARFPFPHDDHALPALSPASVHGDLVSMLFPPRARMPSRSLAQSGLSALSFLF